MLFLHFSDIHFRKTEVGEPDDPNLALRSDIIKDVKRMRRKIGRSADGILLTGDIAFAGHPDEYDFAFRWLEEKLCPAAGCAIENVFVIPGNHDVDRKVEAGPVQVMARETLRGKSPQTIDAELRKWMRDELSSNVIFGPIENYNRFAAKFLCALKPYVDNEATGKETKKASKKGIKERTKDVAARPFACRDLKLNDGSTLRLWGFNTVLVSDITDDERRMLIDPAAAQIEESEDVCHVVMAHHPFNWLKNRRAFEDRCNAVAKIQLFGHEHTRRVDEGKRYLRIRAGAMHPDRDEPDWRPGYNWIDISVDQIDDDRILVVRLWIQHYEVDHFVAIADHDGNEVWVNRYKLPEWSPPEAPVVSEAPREPKKEARMAEASVQVLEPPIMETSAPVSIRSVTIKFFKLREHEQRRLISRMQLDGPGDRDLKDYELVIAAVRRSDEEGRLSELDQLIEKILAGETL